MSEPRIVCAAVRHPDGRVVCGPRHFDATMWAQILDVTPESFAQMVAANSLPPRGRDSTLWGSGEQGFIDQHGKFYTREEAWPIACSQQKLIDPGWQEGRLHSEHLY